MSKAKRQVAAKLEDIGARAERDRHKKAEYVRVGRPPKPAAERGQVFSIRLAAEQIEQLRRVAGARGKRPAVQARDWIVERLQDEAIPYVTGSSRRIAPNRAAKRSVGHAHKRAAKRR